MIGKPWLAALALVIGCQARGPFSKNCGAYPGKRVVLVSVSQDYLEMFQNWLHYAGPWLQDTEQLVVVAEDEGVAKPLRALSRNASHHSDFEVYVSSHPLAASAKKSVNLRQRMLEPDAPLYDSKAFGDLVTQRATHMLAFLDKGCTVLYSDIDNVWLHDPFRQIAMLPQKDLIATDDEPQNSTHTYACTCFLYVQPTPAATDLMHAWHSRTVGESTNQRPFNEVLADARDRYPGSFNDALLPFSEFPPGTNASQFPNATVIHANWIHGGLPKKIDFLEERGLWYIGGNRTAGENATQATKAIQPNNNETSKRSEGGKHTNGENTTQTIQPSNTTSTHQEVEKRSILLLLSSTSG